jgi:hypothetical protein
LASWRALVSAGMSIEIKTAMIPMTTSNSTRVKPFFRSDMEQSLLQNQFSNLPPCAKTKTWPPMDPRYLYNAAPGYKLIPPPFTIVEWRSDLS